jgi:hypothetical protein
MKGGAAVDEVERRFDRAMIGIYETAKRELNYSATRFLQMVSEHGGLVTAPEGVRLAAKSRHRIRDRMTEASKHATVRANRS